VGTTKTIVVVKYVVFCLLCLRLCFEVKRKEKRLEVFQVENIWKNRLKSIILEKDNLMFMVNVFIILVVLFLTSNKFY